MSSMDSQDTMSDEKKALKVRTKLKSQVSGEFFSRYFLGCSFVRDLVPKSKPNVQVLHSLKQQKYFALKIVPFCA